MTYLTTVQSNTPEFVASVGVFAVPMFAAAPLPVPASHAQGSQMSHTLSIGAKTLTYTKIGRGPAVLIVHSVGGHKENS